MNEIYIKDFDRWNRYAKMLDAKSLGGPFAEREIWWCALGVNIGSEEDGKNEQFERPVIIFRKFGYDTSWIIPLSSKEAEKGSRMDYSFVSNSLIQTAKLSQLRLISNKRLLRYIDIVSFEDFQATRKLLTMMI